MLVIKRIHVTYHLAAAEADKDKVDRAFAHHPQKCPIYRSLSPGIAITTELDLRNLDDEVKK